jgi:transcription termination factor NusB
VKYEDLELIPLEQLKMYRIFLFHLAFGVLAKKETIDEIITKAAPEWPIEKIDIMNRNILRLGIYELLFGAEMGTPKKLLSTKPSKWPKLLVEKTLESL